MKTVVLLGMHRSGTSLVSSILDSLGVSMGDDGEHHDKHNEWGYWEDKDFVRLNARILAAAQGNWSHPPDLKSVKAVRQKFKDEIKALIESRQSELWGWKDPRTCLTIELYKPYLVNPLYVCTMRRKKDIYESLQKRGKTHDENYWMDVIREYTQRAYQATKKERVMYVSFSELVKERRAKEEIQKLADFIGVEYTDSALERIHFRKGSS